MKSGAITRGSASASSGPLGVSQSDEKARGPTRLPRSAVGSRTVDMMPDFSVRQHPNTGPHPGGWFFDVLIVLTVRLPRPTWPSTRGAYSCVDDVYRSQRVCLREACRIRGATGRRAGGRD